MAKLMTCLIELNFCIFNLQVTTRDHQDGGVGVYEAVVHIPPPNWLYISRQWRLSMFSNVPRINLHLANQQDTLPQNCLQFGIHYMVA